MSPPNLRLFSVVTALLVTWGCPRDASAQLDLTQEQSKNFYITHLSSVGLLSAASLAVLSDPQLVLGAGMRTPPPFEEATAQNHSRLSADVSDVTLYTTVLAPFGTLFAAREGASYENSLIVYGQAMSTTILLTSMSKQVALRTRPDRWRTLPDEPDNHHSFFSGHSSWSFAAAVSSSLLHSSVETNLGLRSMHWGAMMTFASFTAHARVRAGRHYPTDVITGSLVGTAVGVLVPQLHRIDTDLTEEEITAAGAGLFVGTVLGGLLPDRPLKTLSSLSPRVSATSDGLSLGVSGRFF